MAVMNLDKAKRRLIKAIRKLIVTMLWGGPGIGKSSLIHQIGEELGYNVSDQRLPQLLPEDIRGIPYLNKETKQTEWYPPSIWPMRGEDGNGVNGPSILFLDEIEKASVSVKNAALQLVLDRKVGDYLLPDDCAIICAGNREEDGSFSTRLGQALANRMQHIEVTHNIDVWAKWAHEHKIVEDVIAFLHFQPKHLYNNTGQNAFPSPRSWEMASRLIEDEQDEKEIRDTMISTVGEGVAAEFTAWSKVYRDVDPEDIIVKGNIPAMDSKDPGFKYAVTMSAAMYARKHKIKKYKANIAKFLNAINPEFRVVFFKQQTKQAMTEFSKDVQFAEIVMNIMDSFEI